jgi:hypothetical protein
MGEVLDQTNGWDSAEQRGTGISLLMFLSFFAIPEVAVPVGLAALASTNVPPNQHNIKKYIRIHFYDLNLEKWIA